MGSTKDSLDAAAKDGIVNRLDSLLSASFSIEGFLRGKAKMFVYPIDDIQRTSVAKDGGLCEPVCLLDHGEDDVVA